MEKKKIVSFTDLITWKEGHALVLQLYNITKKFPIEERFSLTDQLRRAAISVTSNVAEGFGRRSQKERLQFYYLAHGSLTEIKNQLLIAKDVGYLNKDDFNSIAEQANFVHKLLQGLITKTKTTI
ncbi:four helix bundle protein [Candidatus Cerribacteria bacterium 'Amazon FNV 2010 28 9']|uniref:Four helix bundle protein n=1 Tax=Candidatus Cerribacteria bacterium 'Amazon FNV 2010 28 9' TaxID=2081795 RepID=A0A317JQJ6_9BACT|nr:MAG: four helix bundle protein [Candidatus Cerribacteria bacterium 'Amazon FNV 2010 28 9']